MKVKEQTKQKIIIESIIKGIKDKKGENIVEIDLTNLKNSICDHFIVCQGNSDVQVESIADSIEEKVKKSVKERPSHKEGYKSSEWILIDYFNIIVHVFQKKIREAYDIEGLWADAIITKH